MSDLGRLERVELRDIWKTEAGDFTPWLAEEQNVKILGDAVGLDLVVQSTEKEVGPFRADILCKETTSDHTVLIENQLERTDHTHLGQLMTYASGLDAVSVIWVAARFTDEHRSALDWLNDITDERINFFGLEIELWRIGESAIAPKFNVVSKPNDWVKTVKKTASDSTRSAVAETRLEFWSEFKGYMEETSFLKCAKPHPDTWMNISIGKSGIHLVAIMSTWNSEEDSYSGEIRTELYIDHKPHAKAYFEALESRKNEIETEVGEALIWYNPENKNVCRIYLRKSANVLDHDDWSNQHTWLQEKLELFHKVFAPRVKTLDVTDEAGDL